MEGSDDENGRRLGHRYVFLIFSSSFLILTYVLLCI